MKNDLKKIHDSIQAKRADYQQLKKALPELCETKAGITALLNRRYVAPFANMRERFLSSMFSGNTSVAMPDEKEMGNFVFGLLLQNGLIGTMLDDVEAELAKDKSVVRMNSADRKREMEKAQADIYELEVIEQEIIGDNEQRDDVSGCALLGLPFDIAKSAGFI